MQPLSLPCPYCGQSIDVPANGASDGDTIECPACLSWSEVHNDSALDLSTNETLKVQLLEPTDNAKPKSRN